MRERLRRCAAAVLVLVLAAGYACAPCPPGEDSSTYDWRCRPLDRLEGDDVLAVCRLACQDCETVFSSDRVCIDTCGYRVLDRPRLCQDCLVDWFGGFCSGDDDHPSAEEACPDECG